MILVRDFSSREGEGDRKMGSSIAFGRLKNGQSKELRVNTGLRGV
jgi:hypothetical protein